MFGKGFCINVNGERQKLKRSTLLLRTTFLTDGKASDEINVRMTRYLNTTFDFLRLLMVKVDYPMSANYKTDSNKGSSHRDIQTPLAVKHTLQYNKQPKTNTVNE